MPPLTPLRGVPGPSRFCWASPWCLSLAVCACISRREGWFPFAAGANHNKLSGLRQSLSHSSRRQNPTAQRGWLGWAFSNPYMPQSLAHGPFPHLRSWQWSIYKTVRWLEVLSSGGSSQPHSQRWLGLPPASGTGQPFSGQLRTYKPVCTFHTALAPSGERPTFTCFHVEPPGLLSSPSTLHRHIWGPFKRDNPHLAPRPQAPSPPLTPLVNSTPTWPGPCQVSFHPRIPAATSHMSPCHSSITRPRSQSHPSS